MFKQSFVAVAFALGFAFTAQAASFTPGTYTASAQGMKGPVTVTVKFSANRIESVTIGDNHETQGIGSVAIERLPKAIVAKQSLKVDKVSGASRFRSLSTCLIQRWSHIWRATWWLAASAACPALVFSSQIRRYCASGISLNNMGWRRNSSSAR